MASGITTAFWGMTINNPDETDFALIKANYPDFVRDFRYTVEQGKEGTFHIQAYIRLHRQQRLSFVKKLYPRGHFKPITSDVYAMNTKEYVVKDDDTTRGQHVLKFNEPIHTIEIVIKKVVLHMKQLLDEKYGDDNWVYDDSHEAKYRAYAERQLVSQDYKLAKIFVSATYKQMWKQFGGQICENILAHTHTHTHSDEKFSREGGINNAGTERDDASGSQQDTESGTQEDCQDYEDGSSETDEGHSEGASVHSG